MRLARFVAALMIAAAAVGFAAPGAAQVSDGPDLAPEAPPPGAVDRDAVDPETPAPPPDATPQGGPEALPGTGDRLGRDGATSPDAAPETGLDPFATPRAPAEADRRYLDDDGFRARFEGRTVYLALGPDHYGAEAYYPGDETTWLPRGGRCERGVWTYADQLFCFRYPGRAPSCWRVFDADGALWAETEDRLLTLRIYRIDRVPLPCDADVVRSTPPRETARPS